MIYLIDFENVHEDGFQVIGRLGDKDAIYCFFTKNVAKISMSALAGIRGGQLHFIEAESGKQSLDHALATYLGYLIGTKPQELCYEIISNDNGFQKIADFWNKRGMNLRVRVRKTEEPRRQPELKTQPTLKTREGARSQRNLRSAGSRTVQPDKPAIAAEAVPETSSPEPAALAGAESLAGGENAMSDAAGEKTLLPETAPVASTETQESAAATEKEESTQVKLSSDREDAAAQSEAKPKIDASAAPEAGSTEDKSAAQDSQQRKRTERKQDNRRGGRRNRKSAAEKVSAEKETGEPKESEASAVTQTAVKAATPEASRAAAESAAGAEAQTETPASGGKTENGERVEIDGQTMDFLQAQLEKFNGDRNVKQQVYRAVVKKYGQKKGTQIYKSVKKRLFR